MLGNFLVAHCSGTSFLGSFLTAASGASENPRKQHSPFMPLLGRWCFQSVSSATVCQSTKRVEKQCEEQEALLMPMGFADACPNASAKRQNGAGVKT